jgi:hypothetical protein
MCCRVSSVAIPSGNFRPLSLSRVGRKYHAIQMPRKLTENTHAIIGTGSSCWPVSRVYAGIGATSPPEMIDAAAEATVWLMLLSWRVHGGCR